MQATAPRTTRMRSLRRLQRRVDHTLATARPAHGTTTQLGQIVRLSGEIDRELARLEELPWPSGRALVSYSDGRPLERRLLPLVRAVRAP